MPQTVPRQWRRAFLRALAASANVHLSLREAGIGRTRVYRARGASPCFARYWALALAQGRALLAAEGAPLPRISGGHPASDETVLTGSAGAGSLRLWRASATRFTRARQVKFLAELRATCNVRLAAARAGVRHSTAYSLRGECAAFRAEWTGAIAEGRVHLEIALIGSALSLLSGNADDGDADELAEPMASPAITGMDARVAVSLLKMHGPGRAAVRRNDWRKAPVDPEVARAKLLANIAAVRAAREAGLLGDDDG